MNEIKKVPDHPIIHKKRRNPTAFIGNALVVIALIVAGAWAYGYFKKPEPAGPGPYKLAVWEWRGPDSFSPGTLTSNLDFAANEKVKTIYLNIGEIIDINEIDDPAEKAGKLAGFNAALRQYAQSANRSGIEVHGLAGSVQWSDPDYRYIPLQIMEYVAAYNAQVSPEEKLDGIQFDIEVYNKSDFDSSQQKTLSNFLLIASQIHDRFKVIQKSDPEIELGFAVPYWYDGENGNIPSIQYGGQSKPVGNHLFDILNQSPNGYQAIMDYRNKADGNNGSIEQAENEIRYAEKQAKNVKVVIGQLTNDTKPKTTTFYDLPPERLYEELNKLNARFAGNPNFDGLAVHDFRSFKKLVDD